MAVFTIKIAGHTAAVNALFDSTKDYCARYLTEGMPEFTVTVIHADLEKAQVALREEAEQEGLRPRTFTNPFLDRTVIQNKLAEKLLEHGILLVHGSAIAVDGQGYLFAADCGTGKSTHVRFWREVFGDRAVVVNDDKPFVKLTENGAILCGSPWSGKHGLDSNIQVPLKGICILRRGPENKIRPMALKDALPMLQKQCNSPTLATCLGQVVPLWELLCTKSPSAAQIAYDAMSNYEPAPCPPT